MNKPTASLIQNIRDNLSEGLTSKVSLGIVKETKLGFWWLPLRALLHQGPIVLLAVVSGGEGFLHRASVILLGLSLWTYLEYSVRTSVVISKIKRRSSKEGITFSRWHTYTHYLITGVPEAAVFLFLGVIMCVFTKEMAQFGTLILSFLTALILIIPLTIIISILAELAATQYMDIKFILPTFLKVLQFTAPVLMSARKDSIHQLINPVSFPFAVLQGHLGEGLFFGAPVYFVFVGVGIIAILKLSK